MNGPTGQRNNHDRPGRMQPAVVVSIVLHVLVVIALTVGLPHLRPERIPPASISVELATVADITQSNKPPVRAPDKPDKKEEPPKKVEKQVTKSNPVKEPKPPEPKKPEDKKPVEVKDKPPEQDALAPPKKVEKKPKKKPEKKPDKPVENTQFSSLLKNLTKEEEQAKSDIGEIVKKAANATPAPETPNVGEQLTISDIDALRQQLAGCWNVFAGASEAEDLAVDIRVIVREDRTVERASIVDESRYARDDRYRAAAESALRAVRDPRCSPLNLPPEKYSLWRDMIVTFDPKDML